MWSLAKGKKKRGLNKIADKKVYIEVEDWMKLTDGEKALLKN